MIAGVSFRTDCAGVDWQALKATLAADDFDNGRTPAQLERSFRASARVVFATRGEAIVGTARALSDGVCNAYVVDVWTHSAYRRRGIATEMMRRLVEAVPGQHIGLQTDDAQALYRGLGFRPQPEFLSLVSGRWLDNEANR